MKDALFLIPARGGSKGIPGKNTKLLNGKPLIAYAIDAARTFVPDTQICVSSDSPEIIKSVRDMDIEVPFVRPAELSDDKAGMQGVMIHALNHYARQGIYYNKIVLLQPTSPFRLPRHIKEAYQLYEENLEMVVSVKEAESNPYYVHFKENKSGFLEKLLPGSFNSRQVVPKVYEYNGAIYIINATAIREKPRAHFKLVKKYVMDGLYSVDIDTPIDWAFCDFLLQNGYIYEK